MSSLNSKSVFWLIALTSLGSVILVLSTLRKAQGGNKHYSLVAGFTVLILDDWNVFAQVDDLTSRCK